MKTDLATKCLLVFVGSGMWAIALTHGFSKVEAKAAKPTPVQSVVKTRTLQIVDANGKVRVSLSSITADPNLSFFDANGKMRISLAIMDGNPSLLFIDQNWEPAVQLMARKDTTSLLLSGPNGKNKAVIDLTNAVPTLALYGHQRGQPAFFLSIPGSGPAMSLIDKDGNVVFQAP